MKKIVDLQWYVLHEYGAPSHYQGLYSLAYSKDIEIKSYEFGWIKMLIKGMLKGDLRKIKRSLINLSWLIYAIAGGVKDKKIILGIAPFDWRIILLWPILIRNKIYWHTSWPNWDDGFGGGQYPKIALCSIIKNIWKNFIHKELSGIFSVTRSARDSFVKYIGKCRNEVVWHSYSRTIFNPTLNDKCNNCITLGFAGRLEVDKGIEDVLSIMEAFKDQGLRCIIVGDGKLKDVVISASGVLNIEYLGYLKGADLAKAYQKMDFILLPSRRTQGWEEAFGMVLIEAMACGAIPLATDHSGPQSIMNDVFPHFIFSEESYHRSVVSLMNNIISDPLPLATWRDLAISKSNEYSEERISKIWSNLLLDKH